MSKHKIVVSIWLGAMAFGLFLPLQTKAQSGYRCNENSEIPLYILLKPNGKHFYTSSEDEVNYTLKLGYKMEGIVAYILKDKLNSESSLPLQRYYNASTDSHRYFLTDTPESAQYSSVGRYEGVVGYLYTNLEVGFTENPLTINFAANDTITDVLFTREYNPDLWKSWGYNRIDILGYACGIGYNNAKQDPIYRLWHPVKMKHFYTNSEGEATYATQRLGYKSEGLLGYLYNQPQQNMNTMAVYRLYNSAQDKHFYTSNELEAMEVLNKGYVMEGVLGYSSGDIERPRGAWVLRLYNPKINDHLYVVTNAGLAGDSEVDRATAYGYQREGDLGIFSAW